mgnify:CR=1 FL=1
MKLWINIGKKIKRIIKPKKNAFFKFDLISDLDLLKRKKPTKKAGTKNKERVFIKEAKPIQTAARYGNFLFSKEMKNE